MTVNELIDRAVSLVEEGYDNPVWHGFIEDTLSDMNSAAKVLRAEDVPVVISSGTVSVGSSSLPEVYEVVDVSFTPTGERARPLKRLPGFDAVSMGWKRTGGEVLVLQNMPWVVGDVNVKYYEKLTLTASTVAQGDYTLNLPESYHEVLLKGVCAFAMQKEEELDRKNDFYGEYVIGKRRMLVERVSEVEPWNRHLVAQKVGEA